MNAENLFWIIHLPLMVLFLIGMADVINVWLQGRVEGGDGGAWRKFLTVLGAMLRTIFSRRLPLLIKAFITEAWFNRRLWRANRLRWLSHFLLLSGFLLLMGLSGISAIADKVLHKLFDLGHLPWVAMWYTPDHPVPALLNEIGAVMMTVGLLFFIVRRYLLRIPQLRTNSTDTWMVIGLSLILLTGWIAEIVRLNAGVDGSAPYLAFVGYPLARLFSGLSLPWEMLSEWLFVSHGILTSLVIVTIPYSKFMHVIAGGVAATVEQFQAESAVLAEKGAAHAHA